MVHLWPRFCVCLEEFGKEVFHQFFMKDFCATGKGGRSPCVFHIILSERLETMKIEKGKVS